MNPALEPEILAALEHAGIRLRSYVPISKLRSAGSGRCTYRIDHAGGTVKARRLEDEVTARQLAAFRSELPEAFAPVILQHGRVLIEAWIDGDPLPDVPAPHYLATAGALLGELHARSKLGPGLLPEAYSPADHRVFVQEILRRLVATGALGEEEAARLERALEQSYPVQPAYGLTHLDFCGENMVIDRTGRLCVVDNDRMRLDAFGYDLARTWHRWALAAPEWDCFCRAYGSQMPFPNPLDSLHFWKIVAAARTAEFRLHHNPEEAGLSVICLRALAAEESV
jgi:hypothetical protein